MRISVHFIVFFLWVPQGKKINSMFHLHGKNYSCYTEATDDPKLTKQTVRIIFLRLQARDTVPNWTRNPNIDLKNTSLPAEHGTSNGGEFNGMKVLAAATITVATVLAVLAVFLCVNRNRQIWNGKGERVVSRSCSHQPPNAGLQPVKGETLKYKINNENK
ncbi:hypothetical protein XENORESO_021049 [Xenotaenia resolanae]|uniref:Uncharacterized protein n=1 Tax=Xenotaenia resolanae TaxID=208358 RepID=A0ABV0VUH7_9TELE